MEILTITHDDIKIFIPKVDVIDANCASDFKTKLSSLIKHELKLILDLHNVKFIDSSGCGALLSCLRQINRKGGDLRLCDVQKNVRSLFELIRMHRIIGVFNTQEEAIKSFQ